jgi:hypothetical protein
MKDVEEITRQTLSALSKVAFPCTIADVAKHMPKSRILAYFGIGYLAGAGKIKINKVGNRWIISK